VERIRSSQPLAGRFGGAHLAVLSSGGHLAAHVAQCRNDRRRARLLSIG